MNILWYVSWVCNSDGSLTRINHLTGEETTILPADESDDDELE